MKSTFTNTKIDQDFMESVVRAMTHKKELIVEKLTKQEEEDVELDWDHERPEHVHEAIHNVFGGKNRIEIPFHVGDATPHPEVEDHLNQHGYSVTNYLAGKAKDKYNRETNIGKALVKTNAPDHIKSLFDNDPERQQKATNMKVVITHRPADVAGMTSPGQSWVDDSCMNYHTGSNRHYLKHEVKQGTHVAYLTTNDDHDLEKPLARVAAKPFHDPIENHTIFRPETRVYGAAPREFHKTVSSWFEKHYPAKPDTVYLKHDDVYDDDGVYRFREHTPEMLDAKISEALNGRHSFSNKMPESNANYITNKLRGANKEQLDKFSSGNHSGFMSWMTRKNANDIYDTAKNTGSHFMMDFIRKHAGNLMSHKNIMHTMEIGAEPTPSMISHRYFPQEHILDLPAEKLKYVNKKNISPEIIDAASKNYASGSSKFGEFLRDNLDKLSEKNVRGLAEHSVKNNWISGMVDWLKAPKANEGTFEHVENAIKNTSGLSGGQEHYLSILAGNHPNPTTKHVAMADSVYALNGVMENTKDKLTHNLALHKALSMKEGDVMGMKLTNPKANDFIGDNELHALNEKHHLLDYRPHAMPKEIFSRLLDHDENAINHLTYKADEGDADAKEKIQNHMSNHAKKLHYRMIEQKREFLNNGNIDKNNHFENLGRMEKMQRHKYYDGTHESVNNQASIINRELIERGI